MYLTDAEVQEVLRDLMFENRDSAQAQLERLVREHKIRSYQITEQGGGVNVHVVPFTASAPIKISLLMSEPDDGEVV